MTVEVVFVTIVLAGLVCSGTTAVLYTTESFKWWGAVFALLVVAAISAERWIDGSWGLVLGYGLGFGAVASFAVVGMMYILRDQTLR